MTNKSKQPVKPVTRSFLRGRPVDERTAGQAGGFFGVLILMSVLTFLVSSAMGMQNSVLRIGANALIVIVVLLIMYSNAISRGTDAVLTPCGRASRWRKCCGLSCGWPSCPS